MCKVLFLVFLKVLSFHLQFPACDGQNKTAEIPKFLDNVETVFIVPETLSEFDKGEQMMGVSIRNCDNGLVSTQSRIPFYISSLFTLHFVVIDNARKFN